MTNPSDQIWAYIHKELAPAEKEHFEKSLQSDPLLREALEASLKTHEHLEYLLPLLDGEDVMTNDQLEERLLTEWEVEHPEYAEASAQKPRRKLLWFTLPLAAAAAAVISLLALPQEPIHWQRTAYGTGPQLRGPSSAKAHYTRAELKQINRELQDAVGTHLEQLIELQEPWNLKIHLQELANGSLAAEVAGHPRTDSDASRFWNIRFSSLESFRENIPLFGMQVAEDIAGQDAQ